MSTNPVVSMPDAERVRRALERCELVVVSDCVRDTDTTRCAARAAAGRRVGREVRHRHELRAAHLAAASVPAAARRGAARLVDRRRRSRGAWASARVRVRLAGRDLSRARAALGVRERRHARLRHRRRRELSDAEYDALLPFQWPRPAGAVTPPRLFADGRFFTPSRKAQLVPTPPRAPAQLPSATIRSC